MHRISQFRVPYAAGKNLGTVLYLVLVVNTRIPSCMQNMFILSESSKPVLSFKNSSQPNIL
jgi:hypothetical protein